MACLEMFNTEQHQNNSSFCAPPPMSPRISFSNDFVDTQQAIKFNEQQRNSSSAAVSSNFEFSVSNFSMMSADELFSKGKLLPFKQENNGKVTTLRDELLNDDDDDDDDIFAMKPPKGPVRSWKEFLGLNKRTHILSSKNNSNKGDQNKMMGSHDGPTVVMERVVEGNESKLIQEEEDEEEEIVISKISSGEPVLSSCRDNVEMGI